ncbi:O-succinylhomoserine sulfhydrylase [Sphingorhabdus lutea]|uniref:O-succinylhomoserine sulfhydrylase n=1 Tax=Sphingorhabdus lutea TaxID=1913578 RepID=A0A1L3JBM4_9SPHN|nr:aminotransferase class V-fold PLP-dependent enzyme [Sphingorhabdus lutea]APG62545.1 O-succinylhomoserine sulfhydrylase [Sphingorhabdus lutea]
MKQKTGQDRNITANWHPDTQAIRAGTMRSEFGETSEALFLTSGYCYDKAGDAAARFAGEQEGMTYSRLQNPTVQMLEERIALMDGAEACRATASGMAAMSTALLCQLQAGDHVVASRSLFGSCRWLIDNLLPKFGIETTVINGLELENWEAASKPNTKIYFFETPANPTMEVFDIRKICALAKSKGITSVVDNAFATASLQRPIELGADVVAYSATKMMDGQGRVLAGAVCGSEEYINEILLPFHRNTGPTISPFNAWVVLKGLETLSLRINRQSDNAYEVAKFLQSRVEQVMYPGLQSDIGHELAMSQMDKAGPIFSFKVGGGRARAHAILDALELVDISNNIGDSRSLMTHPCSTTHSGMSEEARNEVGITEDMIRINVGLEHAGDLIADLDQALHKAGIA